MSQRAKDLAEGVRVFNNEVIAFVEKCSQEDWRKVLAWEDWPLGVAARHIGAGHYEAVGMAKMIINGEKLPEITMEQIKERANQHAREHANCTKTEVLEILRNQGRSVVEFIAGLDDAALDRTGYLSAIGGEMTAQQFIEAVILQSAGEHFANIKAAVK